MTVRLMDGGMGEELYRRIGMTGPDWSPLAALNHFDVVRDLHAEFLEAGAEVLTASTYALGRWQMNMQGVGEMFGEANRAAVAAAEAARELVNPAALIAGSLGPVRASYVPSAAPPAEVIEREVLEQALTLAPYVDLFLCETMSSSTEAIATVKAARATGRPVWVAFTLNETGPPFVRSGERLADAVTLVGGGAEAVLINCTAPETVDMAIAELKAAAGTRPFGAYANAFVPLAPEDGSGETIHHSGLRVDMTPDVYAAHARAWIEGGATMVGGCCGVLPAHIARIRDDIRGRP
ncbi:homocysteine S-methyltransferase family protein [Acuticoccus sp. MNP-M23]|uniref:homocysteine S-methyltransferase family protein n=1 Tax=Acuticoccus sp. MNP-M23 TaxID=3072793 RepID=UPI002814ABEC|nr:homocysteine S-methyltransferase family protein [Acuticoccus sp. MNP-M23]WMS42763.1 homocysteine S-methyltransferase family protein [Acuticoccus sp. MNP-M23]